MGNLERAGHHLDLLRPDTQITIWHSLIAIEERAKLPPCMLLFWNKSVDPKKGAKPEQDLDLRLLTILAYLTGSARSGLVKYWFGSDPIKAMLTV